MNIEKPFVPVYRDAQCIPEPTKGLFSFPLLSLYSQAVFGGEFWACFEREDSTTGSKKKTPWALNATTQKHFWSKKSNGKDNISQTLLFLANPPKAPFLPEAGGKNRTIRPPRGERKWLEYRFLMQQAAAVLVALLFLPAGKGKGVFYYFWRWASFFSFFCSGK